MISQILAENWKLFSISIFRVSLYRITLGLLLSLLLTVNVVHAHQLTVHEGIGTRGVKLRAIELNAPEAELRVMITASIHGNEPAPALATYELVMSDKLTRYQNLSFLIISPANPLGIQLDTRYALGIDLNRDWILLEAPETRWIVSLMNRYEPDIVIDMHEAQPRGDTYFMISYPSGSRVPQSELSFYQQVTSELKVALPSANLKLYYIPRYMLHGKDAKRDLKLGHSSARILRNYAHLRGSLAILFESTKDLPLEDRITYHQKALLKLLDILNSRYGEVKAIRYHRMESWQGEHRDSCLAVEAISGLTEKLELHDISYITLQAHHLVKVKGYLISSLKPTLSFHIPIYSVNLKTQDLQTDLKDTILIPLWQKEGPLAYRLLIPSGRGDSLFELHGIGIYLRCGKYLPVYEVENCSTIIRDELKLYLQNQFH